MSRHFGEIMQNGYLVRDLDAAVDHWTRVIGVGPFYVLEHASFDLVCRGRPATCTISVAIANSGPLQIELIRLESDGPSLYREFLDAGREGLHHVAYLVASIDRAVAESRLPVAQAGEANGFRFAYLETETHPGTVLELIERTPGIEALFGTIAAASRNWNGEDPVRSFAALRG